MLNCPDNDRKWLAEEDRKSDAEYFNEEVAKATRSVDDINQAVGVKGGGAGEGTKLNNNGGKQE